MWNLGAWKSRFFFIKKALRRIFEDIKGRVVDICCFKRVWCSEFWILTYWALHLPPISNFWDLVYWDGTLMFADVNQPKYWWTDHLKNLFATIWQQKKVELAILRLLASRKSRIFRECWRPSDNIWHASYSNMFVF